MRIFKYISIFCLFTILALYIYQQQNQPIKVIKGNIFNTYYQVKIRTPKLPQDLAQKIKSELDKINMQMSVFEQQSEINKINLSQAGRWIDISEELSTVLQTSQRIHHESQGAFDPTLAPLIKTWGFGPKDSTHDISAQNITQMLSYSNFNMLEFSSDYKKIRKKNSQTEINLSAIAKGYAVDRLAKLIEQESLKNYIVEIGGEIRVSGTKDEQGTLWSMGVGVPLSDSKANAMIIDFTDYSVATSGDYRNFREQNGIRYSHTISAKTGYPIKNDLASVTVFAPNCMEADAYATAIMSMGYTLGISFAEKLQLPVILYLHNQDNSFIMKTSTAAQKLIGAVDETN